MNIKKCNCGGKKRPTVENTPVGFGRFVVCPNCDKFGEMAQYDDEAKYKWNEMIKNESNIISLEEMKPHISVQGLKGAHIFPISMFQNIADRKLDINEVEEIEDFLPEIIKEWLSLI